MGHKFSPSELALYRAVDEVLHYVWDPIGVSSSPYARDEYRGYLPEVYAMLKNNWDANSIANCLFRMATETMGLTGNREHHLNSARVLLEWKNFFDKFQADANRFVEVDQLSQRQVSAEEVRSQFKGELN